MRNTQFERAKQDPNEVIPVSPHKVKAVGQEGEFRASLAWRYVSSVWRTSCPVRDAALFLACIRDGEDGLYAVFAGWSIARLASSSCSALTLC